MYPIIRFIVNQCKELVFSLCKYSKWSLLFLFGFVTFKAQSQIITLQMCQDSMARNFPLANQIQGFEQINALKIQNLQTNYLPGINVKAKASYQSEVTSISLPIPGITAPEVPKDQFSANLEINQVIYDGGNTKAAKKLTAQNLQVDVQKVKVDLYKIKEQVNQLYYTSLLLQENTKILELTKETIKARRESLQSAVSQGVVNVSELDRLDAELLKLDQQLIELEVGKKQAMEALRELVCFPLGKDVKLQLPETELEATVGQMRPEQQLFQYQLQLLDASQHLSSKKRMPTIGAFATAGYGKPGYDMFNESVHGFYMVGAQLQWNVWDWKYTNREKEQLSLQKQLVNDNLEVFNKNQVIAKNEAQLRTEKLEQMMEKDKEIIQILEKITRRSSKQLENGSCTSADYLRDVNAEKQARINLQVREIQKSQAFTDLMYITGKEIQ